jgi:surfactin synthase thioesterase subunit
VCSERVNDAVEGNGTRWLIEWPARIAPMVDLICFPGAGAGASVFRSWVNRLPAFTSVVSCQLPGRENRINEPHAKSLARVADEFVAAFLSIRPGFRPFVLFGHSMGGALAFEVGTRLAAEGRNGSAAILSASAPPVVSRACTAIDDTTPHDILVGYDPENIRITGNDELYAALAPIVGGDIAMLRRHAIAPQAGPLNVDVHLIGGKSDPIVSAVSVDRWAEHFTGKVTSQEVPGGHFFPFRESQDRVLTLLAEILRETVARQAQE